MFEEPILWSDMVQRGQAVDEVGGRSAARAKICPPRFGVPRRRP